jgi:hypothetical protein
VWVLKQRGGRTCDSQIGGFNEYTRIHPHRAEVVEVLNKPAIELTLLGDISCHGYSLLDMINPLRVARATGDGTEDKRIQVVPRYFTGCG